METKKEWVRISVAAKMLKRSLTGVRVLVSMGKLECRFVDAGSRAVRQISVESIERALPGLRARRTMKTPRHNVPTIEKSTGYLKLYRPLHPLARSDGYVYEHQLVAEQKLGRPLRKGEVVHHLDNSKINNHPDNLIVYSSHSEHMRVAHSKLRHILDGSLACQCCGSKILIPK